MRGLIRSMIVCSMLFSAVGTCGDLEIKGNLIDRPCRIDPASSALTVSFMDTALPLYRVSPGRSYQEKFTIKLVDCHASTLNKVVTVVFKGQEERLLPGMLAVSGSNAGKLGIAVVDIDGSSLLKLNQVHNLGNGTVVDGKSVVMNFKSYVQATDAAIAARSITTGDYSAAATFELRYQ